jgi:hypothetical protein
MMHNRHLCVTEDHSLVCTYTTAVAVGLWGPTQCLRATCYPRSSSSSSSRHMALQMQTISAKPFRNWERAIQPRLVCSHRQTLPHSCLKCCSAAHQCSPLFSPSIPSPPLPPPSSTDTSLRTHLSRIRRFPSRCCSVDRRAMRLPASRSGVPDKKCMTCSSRVHQRGQGDAVTE